MVLVAWLILWIPFAVSAAILFCLLRKPVWADKLAIAGILASFALSVFMTYHAAKLGPLAHFSLESSIPWISLTGAPIEFGVLVNGLTLIMLLIVTGVGSLIFLYSASYMKGDSSYSRYFASLSLFAFSMLGIVLANNLIQIFIFWELVGLSSYLLIGFWYEKPSAATAGKKAFLTTRVGDVGMMIGILILFGYTGTFNFEMLKGSGAFTLLDQGVRVPEPVMTTIALLLFMGVMGKSAQMPLHVWLPDAMEGPTPVSALIHAATMVAAGVFLLARLFFLFSASPDALAIIAWTGGITAFLAATMAVVQNDIKKILAYSTLSQLGYMVLSLGLASPEAGMYHLTTHAFFKALLFLGAGSLIHAMHTQDIFEMGGQGKGLIKKMPVTSLTFFIGTLALMGLPPLSGFFSKEEILTTAHGGPHILFYLAMATVFLTSFYMSRLCLAVFFPKSDHHSHAHESDFKITLPLILLAILSAIGGFLPLKSFLTEHVAEPHAAKGLAETAQALTALGFGLALLLSRTQVFQFLAGLWKMPKFILEKKYFFDDAYDFGIKYIQEKIAFVSDWTERRVIVEGGANGTARLTRNIGDLLRRLQTGAVQFYALLFTVGITLMLYFLILRGRA